VKSACVYYVSTYTQWFKSIFYVCHYGCTRKEQSGIVEARKMTIEATTMVTVDVQTMQKCDLT
jgi:hypothetical protein